MAPEQLTPEEAGYLLTKLRDDLEYYRSLAGNTKCSPKNLATHRLVENLWVKLARIQANPPEE